MEDESEEELSGRESSDDDSDDDDDDDDDSDDGDGETEVAFRDPSGIPSWASTTVQAHMEALHNLRSFYEPTYATDDTTIPSPTLP